MKWHNSDRLKSVEPVDAFCVEKINNKDEMKMVHKID